MRARSALGVCGRRPLKTFVEGMTMQDIADTDIGKLRIARPVPYRQILASLLLLAALAYIIRAFWLGAIEWHYVSDYLFSPPILRGVRGTIIMTICAMALGILLGTGIAIMRMSSVATLRTAAIGYIWLL